MSLITFNTLPMRYRCLVAMAVLIDGSEAVTYLENDANYGPSLARAAADLSGLEPELRMGYVGTLLRSSLEAVSSQGRR